MRNRMQNPVNYGFKLVMTACVLCAISHYSVSAQQPRFPLSKLGADMVQVKNGPRLLGAILRQDEKQGIRMAVEREWLETTYPKYYKTLRDTELESQKKVFSSLGSRLKEWRDLRKEDVGLRFYLDKRIKKLADGPGDQPPAFFAIVQIKPEDVVRHFRQPEKRKRPLLLAWQNDIPRATVSSSVGLARKLNEKKVNLQTATIQLTSRLPKGEMSDRQWSAHVAAVEYRYRKQVNFQGTGDYIVQTGDGAKAPDLNKVFQTMLSRELSRVLGNGLGEQQKNKDKWKEEATAAAEKAGVSGVRVTRLWQNMTTGRVEVSIHFLSKMKDGTWDTTYEDTVLAKANQQDEKDRKQVLEAPGAQQVIQIAKQLGLNPSDKRIQLALQFGAATQEGQTEAHRRFDAYVDAHVKW